MGYTRQLGQLAYLITYDGSGNITVPASLTQGSVTSSMLKADSSGKLVAAVAGTDFVAPAGLSVYVPTSRTITINGTAYDLSADRSWTIVSGVSSFNTRTGAITLTSGDVTGALTYTPVTNARTITINGTTYDLSADRSWSIVAGLSSFNTRTGAITLLDTDVTGALGYTPVTNARTITINGTTYDLSANRTWVVDTSSVTTRVIQKFTATASQTTFAVTAGYTVGMVDVFLNGIKLDNAVDFTATDGANVVLAVAAATGDIVEVYKYGGQFIANNTLRQSTLFTATSGQTTFTVNYSVGFVDVFYNGSKLDSSEFTATNGTSIVLGTACVLNDKVEVIAYNYTVGAFTGVGGSGTAGYHAKWTTSGTLNNSIVSETTAGIGIGTTPFSQLSLPSGTGWNGGLSWNYTGANSSSKRWWINTDQIVYGDFRICTEITQAAGSINNASTLYERFYINPSGHIGIADSNIKWSYPNLHALQIRQSFVYAYSNYEIGVGANAYYNYGWKYSTNGNATMYYCSGKTHQFRISPGSSGTADTEILWETPVMIDQNGYLFKSKQPIISGQIGTTTSSGLTSNQLIPFDDIWVSRGITYNSNTRRFTVPVAGVYRITMNPFFITGVGNARVVVGINTDSPSNGNHKGSSYRQADTYDTGCINSVVTLAANDYIVFCIYQGQLYNGGLSDAFNQFSIELIG